MPYTGVKINGHTSYGENPWFNTHRNAGLDDVALWYIHKAIKNHGSISATGISPLKFHVKSNKGGDA